MWKEGWIDQSISPGLAAGLERQEGQPGVFYRAECGDGMYKAFELHRIWCQEWCFTNVSRSKRKTKP